TRANYSAMKLSEALTGIDAKAELQSARTNSGMNYGNAVKAKLQSYLQSKAGQMAPQELRDQIEKVIRGKLSLSALRFTGNLLGGQSTNRWNAQSADCRAATAAGAAPAKPKLSATVGP